MNSFDDNLPSSDPGKSWACCQPGTLSNAAGNGPEAYDRREVFFKAGGIAAVIVSGLMLRKSILDMIVPVPEVEYSMTCNEVHQLLDEFIAEQVPPDLLLNMSRHLTACAHCLKSFESQGGTMDLIQINAS